jgi:exopolysaccharide production protein ExoY
MKIRSAVSSLDSSTPLELANLPLKGKRGDLISNSPVGGLQKRVFDLCVAGIALTILIPVMTMVALMVWLADRRNPIFVHRRIGWQERTFHCLKFRSMVPDADSALRAHLAENPDAALEWAISRKLRNDPRVSKLGRLLRSTSLDELPQLINVLLGDMSIVGPRPIVKEEVPRYGADFEYYRACRPGLTGLWQVSGRSDCHYRQRVSLDTEYATRWSLIRDVWIVIRTIPAVLTREGSV